MTAWRTLTLAALIVSLASCTASGSRGGATEQAAEATFQTLTVSLTGGECDGPCGVTLTVSPDGSGVLDARAPTRQVVFRPSDLEPLVSAFNASYERISGLPSVDCPPQYDGHQLAVRVVGVDGVDRELAECLHGLIPSDDVYRHAESLLDRGIEQADE